MIKSLLTGPLLSALLFGSATAAPFDTARVATLPLIEVIRFATIGDRVGLEFGDAEHKSAAAAKIDALDPQIRTLFWLAKLDNGLAEPSRLPTSLLAHSRFFAQLRHALEDARMEPQARLFAAATDGRTTLGDLPEWIELGNGFGDKQAFIGKVVDYVRAHPKVQAWCDAARANLSDADRLRGLTTELWRTPESMPLDTWPEPYRVIFLVSAYDGEVGNGGIHQFFYNSSGDLDPLTVTALRTIGLSKQASAVEKGMGFFEQPYPTDRTRRAKAFDHTPHWTAWDEKLDTLTGEVDDGTVEPALIAYAKRQDVLPH